MNKIRFKFFFFKKKKEFTSDIMHIMASFYFYLVNLLKKKTSNRFSSLVDAVLLMHFCKLFLHVMLSAFRVRNLSDWVGGFLMLLWVADGNRPDWFMTTAPVYLLPNTFYSF